MRLKRGQRILRARGWIKKAVGWSTEPSVFADSAPGFRLFGGKVRDFIEI
jgi:hypothetical protein